MSSEGQVQMASKHDTIHIVFGGNLWSKAYLAVIYGENQCKN